MVTKSGQNGQGSSGERVPLGSGGCSTCYDGVTTGPVPRPPRGPAPPPHQTTSRDPGGECEAAHPPHPLDEIRRLFVQKPAALDPNAGFACTFAFLIIVASVCFYFLSFDVVAQMRVEKGAMQEEARHLEYERQSLEHERLVLKEEREKWEKAHDDSRIPQGAFWEVTWPRWECRGYGKREYWGILRNIPQDRNDLDACMNMPVQIKGVTIKRPERCLYEEGSPHVHGFWMVDWDQPDCKPWHRDLTDKVSLENRGRSKPRIQFD